jgi:hypothetical protein
MSFFCLLLVRLFYLFRRSTSGEGGAGGVWALLLGSVTAIFQFSLGNLVYPGGFGFSRWLYGFVDVVCLPALAPVLLYSILCLFRVFPGSPDFANFALLWVIPVAALRSISWSSQGDPLLLVMVPLLWTALAAGIPFFINCIFARFRWYVVIPSILCILALPLAAASAYWAFFSQKTMLAFLLFFAALIPVIVSITLDCLRS